MENKIYMNSICRGSFKLGTACGYCEKCLNELKDLQENILNLSTNQIIKMNDDFFRNIPEVKEYDMYHCGWDMDTKFWVLKDGRKFCTNHGDVEEFTDKDFKKYRKQIKKHYKELKEI